MDTIYGGYGLSGLERGEEAILHHLFAGVELGREGDGKLGELFEAVGPERALHAADELRDGGVALAALLREEVVEGPRRGAPTRAVEQVVRAHLPVCARRDDDDGVVGGAHGVERGGAALRGLAAAAALEELRRLPRPREPRYLLRGKAGRGRGTRLEEAALVLGQLAGAVPRHRHLDRVEVAHRPAVAAVEKGDELHPRRHALEHERAELIVHDAAVRAPVHIGCAQRLVEAVVLVAVRVRHLCPVPAVVQEERVARLRPLQQPRQSLARLRQARLRNR
mmetsp:Transcript_22496/g.73084  ORF Transcript_22496/g.73084 Transcript_22496/m.73084 type:complete len:280 (-) Transcript_22496:378-1217(-)